MPWIDAWWRQVSGTAAHGLQVTVVGMALVFLTLGLIIVALVLLTRLPGLRAKGGGRGLELEGELEGEREAGAPAGPEMEGAVAEAAVEEEELAQVAAMAIALLRGRRPLRARPRTGARESAWKRYGRAHQLGL